MKKNKRISTVIIDDDNGEIFSLQSYLELIPEIEITGTATDYQKAIKLINKQAPDLIFLNIVMHEKTGCEFLKEFEKPGSHRDFYVVFLTTNDKSTLQALRKDAFDFLIKPLKENEIKEAIQRYLKQKALLTLVKVKHSSLAINEIVSLPTNKGLQFLPKVDIVYVECTKTVLNPHSSWAVVLNNHETIKLHVNSGAIAIINHLGADSFILLSQSLIVNVSFIKMIEYKTQNCYLYPPFDVIPFKISRQYMMALRDRFDML